MIDRVKKFKSFVGNKVWLYFLVSIFIGIIWFFVESSFIFVLQAFLHSIGLLSRSQVYLPVWMPSNLLFSMSLLVIFGIARAGVHLLKTHFANLTQITFIYEQRLALLSFGLTNASTVSSKNIMSAFSEIMNQSGIVLYYLAMLINTTISVILFFLFGLSLAPYEMIIGVLLLVLFLIPFKKINRKIDSLGKNLVVESEEINDILLKGFKNYFFLLIYNQIEKEIKRGERSLKRFKESYIKYSIASGVSSSFPLLLGVLILSVITYVSVTHIKTDSIKLVSFFYVFIRLAQSASEINGTISSVNLNMAGLKTLYSWKTRYEKESSKEPKEKLKIKKSNVEISFEDVTFYFDKKNTLIDNLSFKIKSGDVLVIKGESGVGKSSLLNLILSLNLPKAGKIKINNYDTTNDNIDYEEILGYVGPEPYLISGTLKDNLLYGFNQKEKIDDEDLLYALEQVELKNFVLNLNNGLDEKVSEIAVFSTGQKQRISIARALIRKPSLLILDEATANLDVQTESKLIQNIFKSLENTTTIIVTHKDSFDLVATKLVRLGNKLN